MNPSDPYGIIPRNVSTATVRALDLQVRTIVDYDVDRMRDRVRSDVFINGIPAGVYAVAEVDERRYDLYSPGWSKEALERYAPELEHIVVAELIGYDYRRKVQHLEIELEALKAHVKRTRWWHIRRHLTTLRERIKA